MRRRTFSAPFLWVRAFLFCQPYVVDCKGQSRICVYTDGSCKLPRHNPLAHAGWGPAVSSESNPYNQSGPLRDTVQTSYRAELRAIAQALAMPVYDYFGL